MRRIIKRKIRVRMLHVGHISQNLDESQEQSNLEPLIEFK
jgi:hypothetical protein